LEHDESLRKTLGLKPEGNSTNFMDYLVGGLCAALIFFYLIHALLKPERY
jgi:hypothetical protein